MSAPFRRRHTKNFSTISNSLFDDERLAADEMGMLGFLLSRPHDWEIRRPALMRKFKWGRDTMKRIVRNCLRTGWLQAEKIRLSDGTFKITYEICDEPGPSLSEDEIRAALSVVSTEVGDGSSCENEDSKEEVCVQPHTSSPGVDDHPLDKPPWPIESLPNTDSLNTESTKAPAAIWSELRKLWPSGDILSPRKCEELFAALSPNDRQRAIKAVRPYLANCRAKNRKLCDLSTYLKERRFSGDLAIPVTSFPIYGNTPQAYRWLDYWAAIGQPTEFRESLWRQRKPCYETSEWPPPLSADQKKAG